MKELREYQQLIVDRVTNSDLDQIICLPTGAGKTVIAGAIIDKLSGIVLFVVPRLELLAQAEKEFTEVLNDEVDMIWADKTRITGKKCIVCSKDSLRTQWDKLDIENPTIIFDEAHVSLEQSYKLVQMINPVRVLGLTATPERMDGKALLKGSDGIHKFGIFDELVQQESVASLIKKGFLTKLKYYARPIEGITDVKPDSALGEELSEQQMTEIFDNNAIWGDLIACYKEYGIGRPAIGFTNTVHMAQKVADIFKQNGYKFEVIHGEMSVKERKALIDALTNREIDGLINAALLTYGFDCPPVSYAFSCRHIKSRPLWFQMVGRILRLAPNKEDAIFVDHGDSISEFSEPDCSLPIMDESLTWRVNGETKEEKAARKKKMRNVQQTMSLIQELDPLPVQMVEVTMEDTWQRLIRIIQKQRKENDFLIKTNTHLATKLFDKDNELNYAKKEIMKARETEEDLRNELASRTVIKSVDKQATFDFVRKNYCKYRRIYKSHELTAQKLKEMEDKLDFYFDIAQFQQSLNYWRNRIREEDLL